MTPLRKTFAVENGKAKIIECFVYPSMRSKDPFLFAPDFAHAIMEHMADAGVPKITLFDDDRFWFQETSAAGSAGSAGGILVFGVSEEGLNELGRLESVRLPKPDQECDVGDVLCVLRGMDGELSLALPERGIVLDVNPNVMEDAEIVQDDPFGEGWLVRVEREK